MRILFLGDVVGRSGRTAVIETLPRLRERYRIDFVVVNGENAAGGFGITEALLTELLDAGADVVTSGNHIWDQRALQGRQRRRGARHQRARTRVHDRPRLSVPSG